MEIFAEGRELVREDPDGDIDETASLLETAVVAEFDAVAAITGLECKESKAMDGCWTSTRCRSERTFQWDICEPLHGTMATHLQDAQPLLGLNILFCGNVSN